MSAVAPDVAPDVARSDLPRAVVDLAERSGARVNQAGTARVELTQVGSMRARAGAAWTPFRARQSISLYAVGFEWRAVMGPLGLIEVTDALEQSGPRLSVRALRLIPLVNLRNDPALTKGELQRYLAELPLAPDAILRNEALVWTVLDAATLRVAATHSGVRAHVDLTLGADGMVSSAFAPDRPRLERKVSVARPWTGRFSDYRLHEGRRLPFAAEAAWNLAGQDAAYWRGQMSTWTFEDPE